jgi:hypothetical protein
MSNPLGLGNNVVGFGMPFYPEDIFKYMGILDLTFYRKEYVKNDDYLSKIQQNRIASPKLSKKTDSYAVPGLPDFSYASLNYKYMK